MSNIFDGFKNKRQAAGFVRSVFNHLDDWSLDGLKSNAIAVFDNPKSTPEALYGAELFAQKLKALVEEGIDHTPDETEDRAIAVKYGKEISYYR